MGRAIWKGAIAFGLVYIPVKLYSPYKERVVKFHLLCPDCKSQIVYKRWCPKCKKEVEWERIVKGVKIGDTVIPVSKEELEKIKLKSIKTIEITEFIDASQIDPLYIKKNYYIVPEEGAEKAYSLFKEVLELTGKAAIGRVVLRGKEYVVAIRPYRKGLVLSVLYYKSEVVPIENIEELQRLVVVREDELKLAKTIVEKMSSTFEWEKYKDRYREAIEKLLEKKLWKIEEGEEEGEEEEKREGDILEQLKASLKILEAKNKK